MGKSFGGISQSATVVRTEISQTFANQLIMSALVAQVFTFAVLTVVPTARSDCVCYTTTSTMTSTTRTTDTTITEYCPTQSPWDMLSSQGAASMCASTDTSVTATTTTATSTTTTAATVTS